MGLFLASKRLKRLEEIFLRRALRELLQKFNVSPLIVAHVEHKLDLSLLKFVALMLFAFNKFIGSHINANEQ